MKIYTNNVYVCLNHRNTDLIMNIESVDYSPPYPGNREHPQCSEEIKVLDGYLELDALSTSKVVKDINKQLKDSERLFDILLDKNEDYIIQSISEQAEECYDYEADYYED